jgi:hypothetical protein
MWHRGFIIFNGYLIVLMESTLEKLSPNIKIAPRKILIKLLSKQNMLKLSHAA